MEIRELWNELKFELGGTKLNKLASVREKKLLLGAGKKDANILFIGDDSDLYEDEELRVSSGTSGEFFLKLCDLADISPEKYYITNISKCMLKWRELSDVEKNHMMDYLNMQIALIKPKLIVTLGQETTAIMLGKDVKIPEVRGKLYDWQGGIKIMPTFEPSYVKRSRDMEGKKSRPAIEFWNDLKVIKKEFEG